MASLRLLLGLLAILPGQGIILPAETDQLEVPVPQTASLRGSAANSTSSQLWKLPAPAASLMLMMEKGEASSWLSERMRTLPNLSTSVGASEALRHVAKASAGVVSPEKVAFLEGAARVAEGSSGADAVDGEKPEKTEAAAHPDVAMKVVDPPSRKITRDGEFEPHPTASPMTTIAIQVLLGAIYFFVVVQYYPMKTSDIKPNEASRRLQESCEVSAACDASCANCCLGFCCPAPRQAHTTHVTGILGYWYSLILMTLCPCPTLWYFNSCTDLNKELGGEKRGCFMGCLSALFCSCCVITQDAESLDQMMDMRTGVFGAQEAV